MKKIYLSFISIFLLVASLFAQAPQKFNYQAVARDATGNLIANQNVTFRISILQGSSSGTVVYQETHAKTTNTYGQVTLSVGTGTVVSGTFGSITWGNNSYYIKTEMDPAGGSAYSVMGTTQLLSVPYALYSNTTGGGYVAGAGINIAGTTISNAFPDQTVTLSPGPGIGTTGLYPDFTILNLSPNATHTGDATGNAALSVVKLQGKAVSATIPTENQVLQWVGSQWAPSTLNIPVSGWSLTGNSGTHDGTDFIGTTDQAPITFKVDNKLAGKIDQYNASLGYQALITNVLGTSNTAFGVNAMFGNTAGSSNTGIGYAALSSNKSNSRSTAIGYNAMFNADDRVPGRETFNTALGYEALKGSGVPANNTGQYNTAIGDQAMFSNTSGISNSANGYNSLYNNTEGGYNTANGYKSLFNNIMGTQNTAIGYQSLYNNNSHRNSANGYRSLYSNTTGSFNTANGYESLYTNISGSENTANGVGALHDNISGTDNTATGAYALTLNTTGDYNTAIGYHALALNTTGSNNTATGNGSLYSNTGIENIAYGAAALYLNTTGNYNTAIGTSSGNNISTGSNNIILGYQAGNNITSGSNNIVIGYNIATPSATADNQLVIGATDLLFGDMGTKLIGIGTSAPTQKLEIKDGNLLMSNSGTASELRFTEPSASGANYSAFKAQAQTADLTYTLPGTAPTNGQVLSSASSGLLSWVSNSPDQTVVLNASTGISISSAYPNFTITNSSPNATHTGDATGGAALSVVKLLGRDLAATVPTDGQALKWNNTTLKWEPATDNNTTYTAGSGISLIGTVFANTLPNATHTGDATGGSILSVVKLQGRDVANTLPTAGQALKWNNASSRWEPTNEDNTTSVIKDANNDTKVQVEETANEDKIHFDLGGTERWVMTGARLEPKNTGYSIFIGDSAGYSDDFTNNYSIFIGYGAGRYNTSGNYNTANGTRALYSNTIGNRNTAYGMWALRYNTTASQNTAIGSEALYTQSFNNGGTAWVSDNVAIGYAALYKNQPTSTTNGINNTATGNYALYSNTYGLENTANGNLSLYSNNYGDFNTAIGMQSLYSNINADYNTATGYNALYTNETGYNNTANGAFSLKNSLGGSDNTANGFNTLYTNTTGDQNTAVGRSSLYFNSTGSNNTALGYFAGLSGAGHIQCTFIGSSSYLSTNRTNVTLLGYGIGEAQCTGNNQVLLGNTALVAGGLRAQVTGITAYSDERFKTNIKNNVAGMDFILKLKPVTYNVSPKELHKIWGTPDSLVNKMDFSDAEKEVRIGFVAQDVEKAAKESGFDFPGIDVPRNDKETYSLRYVDFIMPMVKGMQEQQAAMDEQKALIQAQQQQIETLIKRIEQLENK